MSRHTIKINEYTGTFCGDGDKASLIKNTQIDPALEAYDKFIMDFDGIHNMNSSFANALIANLVNQNGPEILDRIYFKGCNNKVKVLIEMAVELGVKRFREETELKS